MNILPKKNWHVRNRDNIQKVRRDEAQAAEEAKQQEERRAIAEREHRTSLLKQKARLNQPQALVVADEDRETRHVNFFQDAEDGKIIGKFNTEHEAEKKAEQEKYERKIGLLTYLGQSSSEGQDKKPWYQVVPERKQEVTSSAIHLDHDMKITADEGRKSFLDPLNAMPGYTEKKVKPKSAFETSKHQKVTSDPAEKIVDTHNTKVKSKLEYQSYLKKTREHKKKKKHMKEKRYSKDKKRHKEHKRDRDYKTHRRKEKTDKRHASQEVNSQKLNIEKLRAERLKRENAEKMRTERFLSGKVDEPEKQPHHVTDALDGRYNSQFNPNIARQTRTKMGDYIMGNFSKQF